MVRSVLRGLSMNILMLPHANLQPVKVDLPFHVGAIHFCDTFEALATHFEHELSVDLVVIDQGQLAAQFRQNVTIGDYMARSKVPVLVADDTVGNLADTFDRSRYPKSTIGVIPNEVMVRPHDLGTLMRSVVNIVKSAPDVSSVQPVVYERLKGLDLVLDPLFADQYGRYASASRTAELV